METRLRAVLYLRLSKEDMDKADSGDDSATASDGSCVGTGLDRGGYIY